MKNEINKTFESTLFSESDIDFVAEQVYTNLPFLYAQNISLKNDEELNKLQDIIDTMNSEIRGIFKKQEHLLLQSIEYQNCLAYYIGVKKGLELKELK